MRFARPSPLKNADSTRDPAHQSPQIPICLAGSKAKPFLSECDGIAYVDERLAFAKWFRRNRFRELQHFL
jgi:hypothetical protein